MRLVVMAILAVILFSLLSSMVFMVRDRGRTDRMVRALGWRAALSLLLFALLVIAFAAGLLAPHTLPVR